MQLTDDQQQIYSKILHSIINIEPPRGLNNRFLILGDKGTGKTFMSIYMYLNMIKDIEFIVNLTEGTNNRKSLVKSQNLIGVTYSNIAQLQNIVNNLSDNTTYINQSIVGDIRYDRAANLNIIDSVPDIATLKNMSTDPRFLRYKTVHPFYSKFYVFFASDEDCINYLEVDPSKVYRLTENVMPYVPSIKNLNKTINNSIINNTSAKIHQDTGILKISSSAQFKAIVREAHRNELCTFLVKDRNLAKRYDIDLARFLYRTESFLELPKNTSVRVDSVRGTLMLYDTNQFTMKYPNGVTKNHYKPAYKYKNFNREYNATSIDFGFVYTIPEIGGNTFHTAFIVLDEITSLKELAAMVSRVTHQIYFVGELDPKIGTIYDTHMG